MSFYAGRKGEETYQAKYKISKCVPHPKYDGSLESGYDIAICFYKPETQLGSKDWNIKQFANPQERIQD